MMKQFEHDIRSIRTHPDGMKEHGWTNFDHEIAMLEYAGLQGWELCAVSNLNYYFKKEFIS